MVQDVKKSWVRRHWILSIFLGILILGAIGSIFDTSSTTSNNNSNQELIVASNDRQYISEDLDTLILTFVSSSSQYTDLQKEENFKQYKGKWIKSSGIVKEVDNVMASSNLIVSIINPENQYMRGATIYFPSSEKDKLLALSNYDDISFEGRIESYSSLMGIVIKDARVS